MASAIIGLDSLLRLMMAAVHVKSRKQFATKPLYINRYFSLVWFQNLAGMFYSPRDALVITSSSNSILLP